MADGEDFDEPGFVVDAVNDSEITAAGPVVFRFSQFLCNERPRFLLKGKDQFLNTAFNGLGKVKIFLFSLLDNLNGVPGHELFLRLKKILE